MSNFLSIDEYLRQLNDFQWFDIETMETLDMVGTHLFRHKRRNFPIKDELRPNDLDNLLHFEVRHTDIFQISYPKSGAAWMQQILVGIMDTAHPEHTEDVTNRTRVPFMECRTGDDPCRERPDPRIFGSHLPPDMLPLGIKDKQTKIVYVWRNPKDILVSLYHFSESFYMLETPQSFDSFFQQFLNGDVFMGSWFDHVRDYTFVRDQLNIHFVQYENMLKDLRGEVEKICYFLGEDLSGEAISRVVEMATFKNMKYNPKANYKDLVEINRYSKETMRKGIAGDWKNHFTVAQNEQFDRVFKEKMGDIPLSCVWEIEP